jgi:hypothetical protein
MTQDEIIEMAKEAGLWPAVTDTFKKELEAFAKLVAAKERAEITLIAQDLYFWDNSESLIKQIRARGVA